METKQQIDHLIELAIVQRAELKRLVEQLPVLRTYLLEQINATIEDMEPQLRSDLIEFCDEKTDGKIKEIRSFFSEAKSEFATKSEAFFVELEKGVQARYAQLAQERALALDFADDARKGLEAAAQQEAAKIPGQVSELVKQELARFPRAGELDQLRKEFSEPRGLNPRGKWKSTETYQKLDLVAYNGDSYVSNVNDNREKPSRSSVSWTLSAARGQGAGGGGISSLNDILGAPTSDFNVVGAEGSNYVRKTLTAGTNVTLEETPTTITINASDVAAQTLTATVVNAESVAITRGQVVYAFAATGNKVSVKLAYNTSDATSAKTFGVVSDDSIAAGATGTVTCVGVVDKLALGTYSEGDTVYLSATPGAFTATKPYAPNHLVYVGFVERANNGNGELYVKIQNGYELDEIHDVQITAPKLAGQTILYDQTNSLWKNANIAGTANQITVTNADAAVTLSLPTTITNVNSITASSATNLTLNGGSSGASIVAGQGTNANVTLTPSGTGVISNGSGTQTQTIPLVQISQNLTCSTIAQATYPGLIQIGANGNGNLANNGGGIEFLTAGGGGGYGIKFGGANNAGANILQILNRQSSASWTEWARMINGNLLIGGTSDISGSGGLKVFGTTASTSTTSGALQVAGGVGIAGDIYGGGNFTLTGGTITGVASGLSLVASGTNQNITLTPSGTGSIVNGASTFSVTQGGYLKAGSSTARVLIGPSGGTGTIAAYDGSGVITLLYNGSNLLLGTGTDSSNGKLQLATHTTRAGGIGFGTDTSLYRSAGGSLVVDYIGNSSPSLSLAANGSIQSRLFFSGTNTFLESYTSHSLILRTNQTAALTLTNGQQVQVNATTASTSTTTGALVVSGGVGVAGLIYSAGETITNSSTGTTAQAALNFGNGSYTGRLAVNGTAYTSDGVAGANRTELQAPFSLNIISAQFKFWANSAGAGEGTSGAANIFNIYGPNFGGRMEHLVQAQSASPYLASSTIGAFTSWNTATVTDNSTAASGTVASQVFHNFRQPILAATNASVTTTDAATLYVAGGPAAGTNQTITNSWGLWNVGKTRLDNTVLVGTGTNSSNGIIQLATHTTSAGGIGFGTDVSLYRSGSNALSLNSGGSTNFFFLNNGSPIGYIVAGGTNFQLTATASLVLQTNNGTTALTLDSSQNATFAGAALDLNKSNNGQTAITVTNTNAGTGTYAKIGTWNGTVGANLVTWGSSYTGRTNETWLYTNGAYPLKLGTDSTIWMTIAPTTGLSTFGGAVSITNTTDSSSTTTGALVVSGGLGVAKNLNAGGNNATHTLTGGDLGSGSTILSIRDASNTQKVIFQGNGQVQFAGTILANASSNAFRIANSQTPASASATGTTGTIAWDASYIYVCTATNTWKRVAIATW